MAAMFVYFNESNTAVFCQTAKNVADVTDLGNSKQNNVSAVSVLK
jgi:hypothetical protein